MKINCKYEKLIPLEAVIEHEKNPNKHPQRQIEMLAKMMKYQGWRHPIIISKLSGKCVAGHGRKSAAKLNGWTDVPVDMQDFEDMAQELSFLAGDNLIKDLSETDDLMLQEIAVSLGDDFDPDLLGLTEEIMLPLVEVKNTGTELDLASFDNFQHECPKCGFEWNDNGTT